MWKSIWKVVLEENGKNKIMRESNYEEVLERIGENILRKRPNWISHILRRNCLLHDAVGGQMNEVKGIGRRRRRTQPLDDFKNRRRYWELKEEAED